LATQYRLKTPFTENARPAIYAFWRCLYRRGCLFDSYRKVRKLQDSLRILSGLYGLLKPLDLIQAYRLEMGTKLPVEEQKIYMSLEKKVTNALNKELEKDELFVNLASNEYFSAVDTKEK
jgi:cytoplasmic iron level regulating protein YaaA (DUF328/UPF0246 family)